MRSRIQRLVDSRAFRGVCAALALADVVALVLLLSGGLLGPDQADEAGVLGPSSAPVYAADVEGLELDEVTFSFYQDDSDEWQVAIAAMIPHLEMTPEEYQAAPGRVRTDAGDAVVAGHVRCRFAVPEGSVPRYPQSVTREDVGESEGVDIWSADCTQLGYDPTLDEDGIGVGGGSSGAYTEFSVPNQVLRRAVGDQWGLTFSLLGSPALVTDDMTPVAEDEVELTYKVSAHTWTMQAFLPEGDDVRTNTPSGLVGVRSVEAAATGILETRSVYVALADPTGQQRNTYLISALSLALPFLVQGAFRRVSPPLDSPAGPAPAPTSTTSTTTTSSGNPTSKKRRTEKPPSKRTASKPKSQKAPPAPKPGA